MAIRINRTFRSRIFFSFLLVFLIFTLTVFLYQYQREKEYKADQLENSLDNITVFAHNYIEKNKIIQSGNFNLLDTLSLLLPDLGQRITIIDSKGVVLYDSFVEDLSKFDNHLSRPEVQKSLYAKKGSNIRKSDTTKQEFYYYSKYYNKYYIRTALVFDVNLKHFLQASQMFFVYIVLIFFLMWIIINLVTKRLGLFVSQLEDFSIKAAVGEEIENEKNFADNELNNISQQIKKIYNRLNKTKDELISEREKLFQHLNVLHEGIAFFSPDNKKLLSNSHFIHYINTISEKSSVTVPDVLSIPEMKPVVDFLSHNNKSEVSTTSEYPRINYIVPKGEYIFEIRAIYFSDRSYEIMITDVSRLEKRRLIKQQLTANIAHELKTPVASLKGYLETLNDIKDLPVEKRNYFIDRAFLQSERLSSLLNDISLLNNIEEAGDLYELSEIAVNSAINDVIENQQIRLKDKGINVRISISDEVKVMGNYHLLTSIFQNLIENTIRYAGKDVTITINNYHTDQKYHYFTYSNNGTGIAEEHLPRIFERFYRADEGRTRENGGTGLGLAIVKNAVQLHKGEISVRNRPEGGIEFIFSLAKA